MGKALAKYLPCPYCNAIGKGTFRLMPKPNIDKPDKSNPSHFHMICTNCGKEVDLEQAIRKFKESGGKYPTIK